MTCLFFLTSDGKTASGERGQNLLACGGEAGQQYAARGSACFAGQRPNVAKKHFCSLDFWFFLSRKRTSVRS
jgi:hypothetical protein